MQVRTFTAASAAGGLALAVAALAGCTSSTYSCQNDSCSVTLKGSGSDTELYDDTVTVTLKGADGTTAELEVDGESLSCREGDTATVGEVDVTCTTVSDGEVELEVVR